MSSAPPVLVPFEHVSMNARAYDGLKQALLAGRLEPGAVLTLRQLADQFGTSVMPVREAVTRLAAEGAVTVLPKRGIVVPALDADEADDLWSLRINLEGEACARAARAVGADELAVIEAHCARVRAAAEAGELHAMLGANSEFQFAVYAAAGSATLLQLIEILRMRSVPHCTPALRRMLAERPPYFEQSWRNHDALVAALAAGDAPAARRVKRADLRALRDFVQRCG